MYSLNGYGHAARKDHQEQGMTDVISCFRRLKKIFYKHYQKHTNQHKSKLLKEVTLGYFLFNVLT